ncbi:zf-HC2 domain-containing protein [Dactylosporangium sp. NPDC000244]|uniref:anti-sigma factor family protein n=1 Tax=Dactylosporangium sp. NPDC000244 TaxID=3154365 RepID=UPI00333400ED
MSAHPGVEAVNVHVLDQLVAYFQDDLSPDEEYAVEAHVLRCEGCQAEFDELSAVVLQIVRHAPGLLAKPPAGPGPAAPAA